MKEELVENVNLDIVNMILFGNHQPPIIQGQGICHESQEETDLYGITQYRTLVTILFSDRQIRDIDFLSTKNTQKKYCYSLYLLYLL